mgnify:CR=1 FL=1
MVCVAFVEREQKRGACVVVGMVFSYCLLSLFISFTSVVWLTLVLDTFVNHEEQ